MPIDIGDALLKVGIDTKEMDAGMNNLGNQLKQHQKAIGVAMVAAGGTILAAGSLAVKTYTEMGDAVDKMSKRTGFATESLSELFYIAKIGGAELTDVEKAVKRMSGTILDAKDGLETYIRAFEHIGLAVEDLEGLKPEEQFWKIGEAIAALEDPTERAAIAQDIFGRAGTSLLPMFAEGANGLAKLRDEAHELGIVFDKEAAAKAAELQDQLTGLKASFQGIQMAIAENVVPILISMVDKIKDVISGVTSWMKEHPALTKVLVIGTAALGALLVAMGTFLLLAPGIIAAGPMIGAAFHAMLGPIGLVTLAISGLIAIGTTLALKWDSIMNIFRSSSEKAAREFERWSESIRDNADKMVADVESAYNDWESDTREITNSLKRQFDQQIQDARDAHDKKMELLEEERLAALSLVDEEAAARLEQLRAESDAIDYELEAQRRADKKRQDDERIANYLSMINAEEDVERRKSLEEDLADFREQLKQEAWEQEKRDRQDAIRDEEDEIRKTAEVKKEQIESEYESFKLAEDAKLEHEVSHYENMKKLADANLASQIEACQDELAAFKAMNDGKIEDAVNFVNEYNEVMGKLGSGETVEVKPRPEGYTSLKQHQSGGLITEPTLLTRIRDMKPYGTMAERSPEYITPGQNMGVNNYFNISQLVVRDEADVKKVARELYRMQQVRI